MEELLSIVEDELVINPHFISIAVINNIWKRDHGSSQRNQTTGKNERVKHTARKELSWIWYMENWKSPYQSYTNVDKRATVVKERLGLSEDWKEDNALMEARVWYATEQMESNDKLQDLQAARKANGAVREFLNTINLVGAENIARNGAPLFKPKDISTSIKELAVTQKSIDELEDAVRKAKGTKKKNVRGGGDIGMYEM
jgi:hypothetical protein